MVGELNFGGNNMVVSNELLEDCVETGEYLVQVCLNLPFSSYAIYHAPRPQKINA